jgi:peptide chain release factor subunit 1
LFRALEDEEWVLWIDVDVVEYPHDIIQTLLKTGKEIVHPHCVYEYQGSTFDFNAWRDKGKKHMDDLRHEGELAKLHSVGGTMLLIKADIHREGLIFPPFLYGVRNKRIRRTQFFFVSRIDVLKGVPDMIGKFLRSEYRGEIETEGLGIMAHDMGYTCWGMPNLEIKHKEDAPLK